MHPVLRLKRWCWWWWLWPSWVILLPCRLIALYIRAQLSWYLPNHSPGNSLWFSPLFGSPISCLTLPHSSSACADKRASPGVFLKKRGYDLDFFGDLASFIIFEYLVNNRLSIELIPGLQSFRKYCFPPTLCCWMGEILFAGLLYEKSKAVCSWSCCDLFFLWKLVGSSLCFYCDQASWWCALTWVCFVHLARHLMGHFNLETCVPEF